MSLLRLPYVNTLRVRGRDYHYFRRNGIRRTLPGAPGTPAWADAYQAALAASEPVVQGTAGAARVATKPPAAGSIAALIASYRGTAAWARLAPATRQDYDKGLVWLERIGHHAAATMRRTHVIQIREAASWDVAADGTRRLVPSRANKVLAALSILMSHAIDRDLRRDNPVARVAKVATDGDGYRAWTEAEVGAFAAWAAASAPAWHLALLVALCTGQRGQDQIRMRWADYDAGVIRVRELKTRAKGERWIPCHASLRGALDAARREAPTILVMHDRRPVAAGRPPRPAAPWKIRVFQKQAGRAIRDAGLSGVVWHGLRGTAASWLAEAGCSDAEIMSITGHTTPRMVQHYRRGADQRRLATAAVGKLRLRHEARDPDGD